jgi:hypothetical protein
MAKSKRTRLIAKVVILFSLGLLLLAAVLKDAILREVVCRQLESETGLEVRLDRVRYNPFTTKIEMRGLTFMNPSEFGESEAFILERVYIDSTLKNLFSGNTVRIDRCELDIALLRMSTGPGGRSNLDAIIAGLKSDDDRDPKAGTDSEPVEAAAPDGDELSQTGRIDAEDRETEKGITIGSLEIHIQEIVAQLDSRSDTVKRYPIDRTLTFENVEDMDEVAAQLTLTLLMASGPDLLKDITQGIKGRSGNIEEMGDEIKNNARDLGSDLKNIFK